MRHCCNWSSLLRPLLVAAALLVGGGFGIEIENVAGAATAAPMPRSIFSCVVCDSRTDANCDKSNGRDYVTPCTRDAWVNASIPLGCRKIVQYVYGERFVSRHCTNLVSEAVQGCIDRVGTLKIKMTYCHCRSSMCNSGQVPRTAAPLLLLLLLPLLLAEA